MIVGTLVVFLLSAIAPPMVGNVALAASVPTLTAQSAVLIDTDTGQILYSLNRNTRRPMASTTKMMTALLAVELSGLAEVATVRSSHLVGGTTAGLKSGERMTIRNLLYSLMLPSGNDAGMTIADYVGRTYLDGGQTGGIAAFVRAMNSRAQQLGLTNTHFTNPHGLDAQGHYSSALDLARLGRVVLRYPVLATIVNASTMQATGTLNGYTVYHNLVNTNRNLCEFPGTYGMKTGWTPNAGGVLVASSRRGTARLTAVVIGSTGYSSFADTRALFRWGYAQRGETSPARATCQESAHSTVYTGTWNMRYDSSYSGGFVRHASAAGVKAAFSFTNSSVSWVAPKGPSRGKARVYLDGVYAATVDLYASTYQAQQVIFTRTGLEASKRHTLEIRVLGTRNPNSSGTRIDVDAFVVQGRG
ncbi:MAG: D-alanyl-D-alanine carboxypeptidase [Chloroflexota bacterium]|nr:D-alanyl-D-alanine carboxypeptidase [Chloroflexota bacterium]